MNLFVINSLRRNLFFFICLLSATQLNAQTIKNNLIVMGVVDSVQSKILGENRKVWVYVPACAGDTAVIKRRYPVVYLLDGEIHFPSVAGMVQQLSEANDNDVCPEMIVVAIVNTHRTRDLTPTKMSSRALTSGGGEKFTEFIEKELMPHIDSVYPTRPYKIMIGHSLGALLVINTLVNHPAMFNAYVAIEPSLWWDDRNLLKQAQVMLKKENYKGKSLFLGIANTMEPGMDTLQVRKDTSQETIHIRSILTLKDWLKSDQAVNGLNFHYKYYKDDNHDMVPLIAEYDALHILFNFYSFPQDIGAKAFDKKIKFDAAAAVQAHYMNASKQLGYQLLPSEEIINEYAYALMGANVPAQAFVFFSMNIRNYPQSFNAYDGMGDYYDSVKNKPEAIIAYKKSLSIKEHAATRAKLDKLIAGK